MPHYTLILHIKRHELILDALSESCWHVNPARAVNCSHYVLRVFQLSFVICLTACKEHFTGSAKV